MCFADLFQDSFPGINLTVLLIRPIAVLDRLWKKGQHLATVRVNDNGLKNLVMIADRPFGRFFFQTLRTADGMGRKIFGTIQGNEIFSVEKLILGKLPTTL